jgi:hypothetical protein
VELSAAAHAMLSQVIEYQHHGRAELDWRKEGLVCRIIVPLTKSAGTQDPQR